MGPSMSRSTTGFFGCKECHPVASPYPRLHAVACYTVALEKVRRRHVALAAKRPQRIECVGLEAFAGAGLGDRHLHDAVERARRFGTVTWLCVEGYRRLDERRQIALQCTGIHVKRPESVRRPLAP